MSNNLRIPRIPLKRTFHCIKINREEAITSNIRERINTVREINNLSYLEEESEHGKLLFQKLSDLEFQDPLLRAYYYECPSDCCGECHMILTANPRTTLFTNLEDTIKDIKKEKSKPIELQDNKLLGYLESRKEHLNQRIKYEFYIHRSNPYLEQYHLITSELKYISISLKYRDISNKHRTALLAKRDNLEANLATEVEKTRQYRSQLH